MRLIAGPCLIESRDHCLKMAEALAEIVRDLPVRFIFKASWYKGNRTSWRSACQLVPTSVAVDLFDEIMDGLGLRCITDIHEVDDAKRFSHLSALQIPALLSRQSDLYVAAQAHCNTINIKKGQFMAPHDVKWAVEKARDVDNPKSNHVMVTERGYTFGYNNLVVDFRSIPIMKATSRADEILFDCTHSVQLPSAAGGSSSGQREYIEPLARAAIVSGVDGLFCEVHDDPANALSDGPCQIPLHHFRGFLERMVELYAWQKQNPLSSFPLA